MPTYEYICGDCRKTFTVSLTISEHEKSPTPKCQHCGSQNVTQILGEVQVITSKKS